MNRFYGATELMKWPKTTMLAAFDHSSNEPFSRVARAPTGMSALQAGKPAPRWPANTGGKTAGATAG